MYHSFTVEFDRIQTADQLTTMMNGLEHSTVLYPTKATYSTQVEPSYLLLNNTTRYLLLVPSGTCLVPGTSGNRTNTESNT